MPVVRCGDDHSLNILVLVHLPEVAVPLAIGIPDIRQAFIHAWLIAVAQAKHLGVLEALEIGHVLFSYQPEADKADAHAVVRAKHPII